MEAQDSIDFINSYILKHVLSYEETIDLLLDIKEWCSDTIDSIEEAMEE